MAGLAAGIRLGQFGVVTAMQEAAQAAVNAAKETLDIHSPSRVFRDQVGVRVSPGSFSGLSEKIRALLQDESYSDRIRAIREKTVANFGRSGEVGGEYILSAVKDAIRTRKNT